MTRKTALLSLLFSFLFALTIFAGTVQLPDTGQGYSKARIEFFIDKQPAVL